MICEGCKRYIKTDEPAFTAKDKRGHLITVCAWCKPLEEAKVKSHARIQARAAKIPNRPTKG